MKNRQGLIVVGLIQITTFFVGCSGPKLAPVKGTVTLDGKPVAFKSVIFTPDGGTGGSGAAGYTNGEGNYQAIAIMYGTTKDMIGVMPGRYRVTIVAPTIAISESDFSVTEAPKSDAPGEAAIQPTPLRPRTPLDIPTVYASPETTPLKIEIPPEGGVFDLALTSA